MSFRAPAKNPGASGHKAIAGSSKISGDSILTRIDQLKIDYLAENSSSNDDVFLFSIAIYEASVTYHNDMNITPTYLAHANPAEHAYRDNLHDGVVGTVDFLAAAGTAASAVAATPRTGGVSLAAGASGVASLVGSLLDWW